MVTKTIHPSFHLPTHPFMHLSIYISVLPSTHPSKHTSINLSPYQTKLNSEKAIKMLVQVLQNIFFIRKLFLKNYNTNILLLWAYTNMKNYFINEINVWILMELSKIDSQKSLVMMHFTSCPTLLYDSFNRNVLILLIRYACDVKKPHEKY